MNSNIKVTAFAALAALMGSGGAFADDTNTVELTTKITVRGAETCSLDVSSLNSKTNWNLDWALAAGAESGTLSKGMGHEDEPLFVKVKFAEGSASTCSLTGMKIQGSSSATASTESTNAFRTKTGEAFWRFMPVMAQLKLFTDATGADDSTTGAIELSKVTVKDRNGADHSQAASATHAAMAEVTGLPEFKTNKAVALTNNYLADNGVLPLVGDGTDITFTVEGLAENQSVKSALIGVGALVAMNPEDENGDTKVTDIADGAAFNMPYAVNVTLK
ncbi:hypothetical protein, partial [Pseudomonas canadensis]|uniref:hypothetical protein n=1 Tax=Pseudomonas canadensis TaxID=915099 RepID=UPI003BA2C479